MFQESWIQGERISVGNVPEQEEGHPVYDVRERAGGPRRQCSGEVPGALSTHGLSPASQILGRGRRCCRGPEGTTRQAATTILRGLLFGALLSGCAVWQPDWKIPAATRSAAEAATLVRQAEDRSERAGGSADLEVAMAAWQAALAADPANPRALIALSNQRILYGAAYAETLETRKNSYRQAMSLSALAMDANPAFHARIEEGEELWEAVDALTLEEIDAMGFWCTAFFYYYKDCQGPVGQVLNFRWMQRTRRVMERMTELDPEWGHGMLHFLWGIYYLAIPEAVGGDRERSAEYFAQAIASGPRWLQHRWGRGRYYQVKMGDREACRLDLEWVAAQEIDMAEGPYAWRVYIQSDARHMLQDLDRYF